MSETIYKVTFAGRTVDVVCYDDTGINVCNHLFNDIPETPAEPAHHQFEIIPDGDNYRLTSGSKTLYTGELVGDLAGHLVGDVIYHLTDKCDSGLVIHAAALHGHGITIAMPANSGSGKTSMCAWLLTQGFAYLTDELIHIPLNTQTLVPFTRPLNFKRPGFDLIKREFDIEAESDDSLWGSWASLVPHRKLGEPFEYHTPELTHLVFPKYDANDPAELKPISPARSGFALMECLVNARNLPGHGFQEVTRVTRGLKAFSVGYQSFDDAKRLLLPELGIDI